MLTKIGHAVLMPGQRALVTSDIHGHADLFRQVLRKADYHPKKDVLVIVGDMLEKGYQSLETVRMVMDLSREGRVYTLIGNADLTILQLMIGNREEREAAIRRIHGGKSYWGWTVWDEICAEMHITYTPDMDFDAVVPRAREHLREEIAFLREALTVLETPEYIFVHAALPHERLGDLEGTDNLPLIKTDDFYASAPVFSKWVVTGHWPAALIRESVQSAAPVIDEKRRLIFLDGGCGVKRIGQLNMMVLENGRRSFLYADGHRRLRALLPQAPSREEAVYIKWTTRFIESAEPVGDRMRIRYHGRELEVPAGFVSRNPWDGLICDDVTDARLEVEAGDTLYCIQATEKGLFCKKDSRCGWYDGPYEWIDGPPVQRGGMIQ